MRSLVVDDEFVAMVSETHPASRLSAFLACNNFDAMEEVGGIVKKTLVVVGSDDRLTPVKYARFLSDRLENATLEVRRGDQTFAVSVKRRAAMSGIGK